MVYTVGEMAKKLDVPASTLRYYDKEGLLPFVERSSGGIRMFQESDFEWLQVIGCMNSSARRPMNSASGRPSASARWGVMPVIIVAPGEGSRSSAGRQNRLIGSPTGFRSASVRMAANWAMRVRRGSRPKVSRSYQRKVAAMASGPASAVHAGTAGSGGSRSRTSASAASRSTSSRLRQPRVACTRRSRCSLPRAIAVAYGMQVKLTIE